MEGGKPRGKKQDQSYRETLRTICRSGKKEETGERGSVELGRGEASIEGKIDEGGVGGGKPDIHIGKRRVYLAAGVRLLREGRGSQTPF